MKSILLSIQLLLLVSGVLANGPDTVIACHFNNVPFTSFSNTILKETGVKIYYLEKWVDHLNVTLDADRIAVIDAVTFALSGSGLEASVWNNHIVLLPGEKLLAELPSFEHKKKLTDSTDQMEKTLTASEERYLTGRMADALQTIRIGREGGIRNNLKAKVLGRVLDEESGEAVSYTTMYISEINIGIMADINGFFTIMLKPGKYNVLFEFLGYKKERYLFEVLSDGTFTIQMKKAVVQMNELIVYGDRQINIQSKDPGLDKISMKSVKDIPMVMGERNILSVSALLPGIVTPGEGSAGLNVRGGSSDQNAFYINKIPIYNTSHLFGFFPAFNSDIIKDFSIYKGYMPAQYGGRLSSIFNIITRQGNLKHWTAHGGLSPITGNIVVEGPIKKDTCSILLSARSSYSDWILRNINEPTIRNSSAKFSDLSGSLHYDIQKTQVSLFAYHSNDRFRLADINNYEYSNSGASLIFSHRYTNALRGEFALIGSQYEFSTIDKQEVTRSYEHKYLLGHYEARVDFKHVLSEKNILDYGAVALLYKLDRGNVLPYGEGSLRNPVLLGNEKGLESALYISDAYDVLPWLNLTAGIRYAIYNPLGPKTVYNYASGFPKDIRYISDSLSFGKNKVIRWNHEPDFRASANISTDADGSIKLAFNQTHQNLFMLNNTVTIAPGAQWKLSDYHLKPSASKQYSLGVFRLLPFGLESSLEIYYKQTSGSPEFKDGAEFLGSPLTETIVLQGKQNAYGAEFFLKRSNQRLEGWLSYTYSRSKVKVDGDFPWDKINDGKVFPANFDIPHVLNMVMTYHLTRRVTFSSIVTYQSGKPITYPVSVYYVDGVPTLDYSSRNAYRIPNYFRTDISMTIEGSLKKNKFMHSSLSLNLYNVTGRANPYSVFYNTSKGRITSYKYSVISVPIFSATWIFKLGNYASD